ncbi:MAG: cadmium-translocating P-type ATPase [Armatimonadetes bacterium]|nr:cadmium-translocating P-type ATPase [Armatimonadota bacterium]
MAVRTIELPIRGMDCADCSIHVQRAIAAVPGVESAVVSLASEKAVVRLDPKEVAMDAIRTAVQRAGYEVASPDAPKPASASQTSAQDLILLGVVAAVVLLAVAAGEWLGIIEDLNARLPWPIALALIVIGGFPVFRNVLRAALHRQVLAHTLMTIGAVAAAAVGQWATAAVVVFFMRVGDYIERFTTDRARRAVKDLTDLAPQMARVERDGGEHEVPVGDVRLGDIVVIRPGEVIPVDGEVMTGQATVDQATITGESMPVEVGSGASVYAATTAQLGSIRVRAVHVGKDTTFGRVIKLVEEAEVHRAQVQRVADRFAGSYLPVVAGIAALTFLIRRDPLATAAVLVVACSCSFALATPIAIVASIGAAAKRGLIIKGGKYLEALAKADVLLVDKTGTLTLGRPVLTDVVPLDGAVAETVLALAASAERYSEHPVAEAVRRAAHERKLPLDAVQRFEAIPGLGVRAQINGKVVTVGRCRLLPEDQELPVVHRLEAEGKTPLLVAEDGRPIGVLAVADQPRAEVPAALAAVRALGVQHIELLTGDTDRTASALAKELGIPYRAELMPEDKIAVVKAFQGQGRTVVMIGDGVNDAPALAQADVGMAMGAAGSDVAIEAAHLALMREDWWLVPAAFRIARRTMNVVKVNIGFTTIFNAVGISLAALGVLPPMLAAAAQSIPDVGILANSSRLLRPGRLHPPA